MVRLPLLLLTSAGLMLTALATAQQPPDFSKVEITTTDLGHDTYMLQGLGGNITVIVAADGVIMVDGEYAPLHDKIKAAIAKLSAQPVRYLINTHFHGDHTGGNAPFAKDGAIIVAQQNVKSRLAEGTVNGLSGAKSAPVSAEALPSKTYDSALTLKLKDREVKLRHVANAHTDGDTYVWIADADVLATGDTVAIGRYPNIDFANGGDIRGMIGASDVYLKLVDDHTKIVPGHGPLADKAALAHYRAMLVSARDRMAALIKAGKSEADAIAARPFADFDKELAATEQQSQNFIRVVYHSLKPS